MIRWILFDLGNVLVHHVLDGKSSYTVGKKVYDGKIIESIYSCAEYDSFCCGKISEKEFVEKFLKDNIIDLTYGEFVQLYKNDIRVIDGMIELVREVSQKYKLAIVTNEGIEWARYKLEKLGMSGLFDHIIISGELGVRKPDVKFYKKTLELLKASPEECLFIDDQEKNCVAAESIGIKSVLFTDKENLKTELL